MIVKQVMVDLLLFIRELIIPALQAATTPLMQNIKELTLMASNYGPIAN
jgi:hypothetical protein